MLTGSRKLKSALFGVSCFVAGTVIRVAMESLTTGTFVTFYPTVIAAALIGGWRAGLICAVPSFLVGWYLFVPPRYSFAIEVNQSGTLLVFIVSCALVIFLAYRREAAMALLRAERDRSELLFEELQHRVANNMMLVAKLLDMHRRQLPVTEESARAALRAASERISTFGRLHRKLHDQAAAQTLATVILAETARELLSASGAEYLDCRVEPANYTLDLDRLTAVTLITSEALTNSLKYAFPCLSAGTINITLRKHQEAYVLTVADNGVGQSSGPKQPNRGIGTKVMQGLAQQLGGQLFINSCEAGTRVELIFPAVRGQVLKSEQGRQGGPLASLDVASS